MSGTMLRTNVLGIGPGANFFSKNLLTKQCFNAIINVSNEREEMLMYLVQLGRDFVLPMDTIVEGMTVAVDAFKSGWEVDVINSTTGEVMVSLRDGEVPYFSSSIHEVI